jgi:3-oxoacyl-[acyl-carrier-protein] synthase II
MIPPTINYEAKDPACDLDYVLNQPRAARIENVLVDALGSSGSNASMVISRYKGLG